MGAFADARDAAEEDRSRPAGQFHDSSRSSSSASSGYDREQGAQDLFRLLDHRGRGTIDSKGLLHFARALGFPGDDQDWQREWDAVKSKYDWQKGGVTIDRFRCLIDDEDGPGYCCGSFLEELVGRFRQCPSPKVDEGLTPRSLAQLGAMTPLNQFFFNLMDQDADGFISRREWDEAMIRGSGGYLSGQQPAAWAGPSPQHKGQSMQSPFGQAGATTPSTSYPGSPYVPSPGLSTTRVVEDRGVQASRPADRREAPGSGSRALSSGPGRDDPILVTGAAQRDVREVTDDCTERVQKFQAATDRVLREFDAWVQREAEVRRQELLADDAFQETAADRLVEDPMPLIQFEDAFRARARGLEAGAAAPLKEIKAATKRIQHMRQQYMAQRQRQLQEQHDKELQKQLQYQRCKELQEQCDKERDMTDEPSSPKMRRAKSALSAGPRDMCASVTFNEDVSCDDELQDQSKAHRELLQRLHEQGRAARDAVNSTFEDVEDAIFEAHLSMTRSGSARSDDEGQPERAMMSTATQLFEQIDADRSGQLTAVEIQQALRDGVFLSHGGVAALPGSQAPGDGAEAPMRSKVSEFFHEIDEGNDGVLSEGDLKQALKDGLLPAFNGAAAAPAMAPGSQAAAPSASAAAAEEADAEIRSAAARSYMQELWDKVNGGELQRQPKERSSILTELEEVSDTTLEGMRASSPDPVPIRGQAQGGSAHGGARGPQKLSSVLRTLANSYEQETADLHKRIAALEDSLVRVTKPVAAPRESSEASAEGRGFLGASVQAMRLDAGAREQRLPGGPGGERAAPGSSAVGAADDPVLEARVKGLLCRMGTDEFRQVRAACGGSVGGC